MHAPVFVGDLVLDTPLVNGSGVVDVVAADASWNLPEAVLSKLGAFVTKTVTRLPRAGSPEPRAETWGDGSLVNAAGLPNPGVERAMEAWRGLPERLQRPIVVSIGGAADDLPLLARWVEDAGWAAAIELNLSCPNVSGGLVAADAVAVHDVVRAIRRATGLPLLAKLTPACGDPAAVARAATAAGADALVAGNTMPVRAVDTAGAPLLGAGPHGGLSGRALHPIALRLVAEVAEATHLPVVGLGGVDGPAAARRMMDAGARIVGVGTAALLDPAVVDELAGWLGAAVAPAPA